MNKLIVFPLFFFLSFSISAFAYTDYVANPNINTDINGLVFQNDSLATFAYNATCAGHSGCLIINTSSTGTSIYVYPTNTLVPNQTHWTPAQLYASGVANLVLPAYTEGILTFSSYQNATLNAPVPLLALFRITAGTLESVPSAYVYQNTTTDMWHNYTLTIPASTVPRSYVAIATYQTDNVPTTIYIDKFKFFTFDVTTARQSVFTDYATESATYCGTDAQTQKLFIKKSTAANNYVAVMASNLTYDNMECCVYQMNYTIMARRCSKYNATNNLVYNSSDAILTEDGYEQLLLIKQISNSQLTYSGYLSTSVSPCTLTNYIVWNGAGTFNWNCEALNASDTTYVFDKIKTFTNKSGTLFNLTRDTAKSPYYSFFSQRAFAPTCTCSDSMETCLYYPNEVRNTTCGSCGCDLNAQYCLINSTESGLSGTWCDSTDNTSLNYFTYINDAAACTQYTTTGSCPAGTQCVFHATTRSIECFNNATGQHQICVDSNGLTVDCATTGSTASLCWNGATWVTCPDYATNAGTALALWFGTFFGFGNNIVISQNITSILLTLIISIVIVILLAYAGVGGGALKAAFMLSAMMLLVLFTLVLWFPSWLFVVMIVLTALGVSGLLGKIIGGG